MAKKGRKAGGAAKRPAVDLAPPGGKTPRVVGAASAGGDDRPTWRFGKCDFRGPWPWTWDALTEHLATLVAVEAKPWAESERSGTIGCIKRIPTVNLPTASQKELQRLRLDDFDPYEIRLGGKPRFWGVRVGYCFHFVWWDPEHQVCPGKR